MDWKRKFGILAAPAALVLVGGAVAVQAQAPAAPAVRTAGSATLAIGGATFVPKHTVTTTKALSKAASSSTEPSETAAESVDADAPGVGHEDPAGDVNHDFQGSE